LNIYGEIKMGNGTNWSDVRNDLTASTISHAKNVKLDHEVLKEAFKEVIDNHADRLDIKNIVEMFDGTDQTIEVTEPTATAIMHAYNRLNIEDGKECLTYEEFKEAVDGMTDSIYFN
jgi:hypothetical protein